MPAKLLHPVCPFADVGAWPVCRTFSFSRPGIVLRSNHRQTACALCSEIQLQRMLWLEVVLATEKVIGDDRTPCSSSRRSDQRGLADPANRSHVRITPPAVRLHVANRSVDPWYALHVYTKYPSNLPRSSFLPCLYAKYPHCSQGCRPRLGKDFPGMFADLPLGRNITNRTVDSPPVSAISFRWASAWLEWISMIVRCSVCRERRRSHVNWPLPAPVTTGTLPSSRKFFVSPLVCSDGEIPRFRE